jgi:hypothetical protein
MDIGEYSIGSVDVVLRDVFPNLVEVGERFRMEGIVTHRPERRRSLFSCSRLNASSPSIGLARPPLRSSKRLSFANT